MSKNNVIINNIDDIEILKNESILLLNKIDNLEIEIINDNHTFEDKIKKYKLFIENLIIEHHKVCSKIFDK